MSKIKEYLAGNEPKFREFLNKEDIIVYYTDLSNYKIKYTRKREYGRDVEFEPDGKLDY